MILLPSLYLRLRLPTFIDDVSVKSLLKWEFFTVACISLIMDFDARELGWFSVVDTIWMTWLGWNEQEVNTEPSMIKVINFRDLQLSSQVCHERWKTLWTNNSITCSSTVSNFANHPKESQKPSQITPISHTNRKSLKTFAIKSASKLTAILGVRGVARGGE